MRAEKGRMRRVLALILTVSLILPAQRLPALAAGTYEDYLDGWKVDCTWNDLSYDYSWDSSIDTLRRPGLIFTYRLENADRYYAPGSIRVEIPGIGNSYRKGIKEAYSLPTDSDDSEWDVSWDRNTDMYIFTNTFDVEEGQSVNGGFEVIWELESREVQNGYTQKCSPEFSVSQKGRITLRPLGFSFTSLRDRYRLELSRGSLNSSMSAKADPEHIWYGFTAVFNKDWLSRGLDLSTCSVTVRLPSGTDLSDLAVVDENGKDLPFTEQTDGLLCFDLFADKAGDLGNERKTLSKDFMIGIPRGLMDGENMTVHVHLDRKYNDEEDWVREAGSRETVDQEITITVDEYEFPYQGLVYATDLWNELYEDYNKPPDFYKYDHEDELTHQPPPEYEERLNKAELYSGKVVEFVLRGSARKDYASPKAVYLFATPSDWKSGNISAAASFPEDMGVSGTAEVAADDISMPIPSIASASEADGKTDGSVDGDTDASVHCDSVSSAEASARGDTIAGSSIGEKEEYSMVLGDDVLAVLLNDGSMRILDDDEYDFTYVTLPLNDKGYSCSIYTAASKDTPFEEYELLETTDMKGSQTSGTCILPDGVKAVFVRTDGISGNLDMTIRVGVRLHLDRDEEQEKDLPDRTDSEGRIVNFSFFRALSANGRGGEYNDCEVSGSYYGGMFGEELADRDKKLYGEWLLRDYSNVWLRSAVMSLKADISIDPLVSEGDIYSSRVTVSGLLRSDNEDSLSRFSLYTVLPDGLRADFDSGPVKVTGTLTDMDGAPVADPEDYVSISEGRYNGRSMIIADFDFSGDPLLADKANRMGICYPVRLSRADQLIYGDSYTVSVYLLVHDEGTGYITGSAIITDEYDIDGNGDTAEKMAFATARAYIEMKADEWREFASKYVKSGYSQGYEAAAVTSFTDPFYEYRLDFGMGSAGASDIVFFDRLEQGALISVNANEGSYEKKASEWQGELCQVDTSYAESKGLRPTVYYSTNADEAFDLSSPGWITVCPDDRSSVRSIAVALDTRELPEGVMDPQGYIYILVKMRAPANEELIGKTAVNQYTVRYVSQGTAQGTTTGPEERYVLPSGATSLKLMEGVGKITLQKVDADNVIRVDADGSLHYAALTGGTFQIYDGKGQALFESPRSLNSLGRLVVENVDPGTYYWEEVTAPEGYERIPGRHPFTVDESGGTVTVENHRLSRKVILKKYDRKDPEKFLPGAQFALYFDDGEPCMAGVDYLLPEGVDRMITGEDGSITLNGLKEGAYLLKEITAPPSYSPDTEPIRFSVTVEDEALPLELFIENDKARAVLTIGKEVNDVCETFGDPTFIFKVTRSDGEIYYTSLTLTPSSHTGSVSLNVEQGYTYTVEEIPISRYKPGHAEAVLNAKADEGRNLVVADLLTNDKAGIKFYNVMEQYEKFSHTTVVVNSIK